MTKSERYKIWYEKNKARVSEHHKKYRENNKEKIAEYQHNWAIKNKEHKKRYSQKWKIKNSNYHRDYARRKYINYRNKKDVIRVSIDKRPYPNFCEVCGREQRRFLAYHHWDDSKPHIGMWLCNYCHCFAERVDGNYIEKYINLKNKLNGENNGLDK